MLISLRRRKSCAGFVVIPTPSRVLAAFVVRLPCRGLGWFFFLIYIKKDIVIITTMVSIISDLDPLKSWKVLR